MSSQEYEFKTDGIPWEALNQSTSWYDKEGTPYKIREMTPKHARASLRILTKLYGMAGANSQLGKALRNRAS